TQTSASGPDVATAGEGESDDLPGIRGAGEVPLIAGQRRVEAAPADRHACGACAFALDGGAIGKNKESGWRFVGPGGNFTRAQRCGLCGQSFARVVHLLLLAAVGGARRVAKSGAPTSTSRI